MKKINWFQLLVIVITTEFIGLLSSIISGNIGQDYNSFIKPALSPPGWFFAIIWPILYLLMGIAVYIIYQEPQTNESKKAIILYWIQLFVNFLWPIVFFRLEWYWISVVIILILDALVFIITVWFYNIKKTAGLLMIPYLVWILFATYLNIGIAILNYNISLILWK